MGEQERVGRWEKDSERGREREKEKATERGIGKRVEKE